MRITQEEINRLQIEKFFLRENALTEHFNKLRSAGVRCERKPRTLLGFWKGEPFAVFVRIIAVKDARRCYLVAEITTRYKGKDHTDKEPVRVLKG
jgi:hypothetical protein